jgi:hypothetical protein
MNADPSPDPRPVHLSLMEFLTIPQCPDAWRPLDLYLLRDEEVVFYVGQSYVAFERVWVHLRDGFKGRSAVGRFVWCNWPASLRFTIELLSSASGRFAAQGHDLDAAERQLIDQLAPCFNLSGNPRPAPLPERYAPPSARLRCSHNLNRLIRQAGILLHAEQSKARLSWD